MKSGLLPTLIIAVILSIITSKIAYFGFNSNLMANIFSQQSFRSKFSKDVYKYRVLSSYLLLSVDHILSDQISEKGPKEPILTHTKGSTVHFYYAFYYLNTFFLVLTSIIAVLLFYLKSAFILNPQEMHLLLFTTIITINFSQFIISPYDISSYFFQLLILYIFLHYTEQEFLFALLAISALIIISTLNRESSALSVALLILLSIQKWRFTSKTILMAGTATTCFIITYIGIRHVIPDDPQAKIFNPYAGHLLSVQNLRGLAFWILFFLLPMSIANSRENRRLIILYHLLCVPYIYTCLKDGALMEIRLYLPLFLCSLFLAKLSTDNYFKSLAQSNIFIKFRLRSQ